jgi:hypothetical protein
VVRFLAGGAVTTLASGLFYPTNPAVSASGVYFSTFTGPSLADTVQSVPLTGGTPQLIASGLPNVWGVAVDGARVYWSTSSVYSAPK